MKEKRDDELVLAAQGGDTGAYGVLVRRHSARVFAVCLAMLGNVGDSEDMAQETLVRAFGRIATLRDNQYFAAWVSQIARNLCRDLLRSRKRHRELLEENQSRVLPPRDDYSHLREALASLPTEHRLPLMLYYFDGRTTRSIAQTLGLSQAGACTRLYRARKALRKILAKENHDN